MHNLVRERICRKGPENQPKRYFWVNIESEAGIDLRWGEVRPDWVCRCAGIMDTLYQPSPSLGAATSELLGLSPPVY